MKSKKAMVMPKAPHSLMVALKKLDLRSKFADVHEDRRQRLLREQHGNVVSELQRLHSNMAGVAPGFREYVEARKAQARAVALKINK